MTIRKSLQRRLILGLIIVSGCLMLVQTPAYPEAYIGGQFGVTIPGSLSNVEGSGALPPGFVTTTGTFKSSDLDLKNSFAFGAKVGYYSHTVRWFGVETEAFYSTPHLKQQPVTITGALGSVTTPTPGEHFRVITLAPLNLLARYPGKRLQPYVGVGPGIFFARLVDSQTGESQSSTRLGLNAQVGLRYFFSRHVAMFGEYKFNHTRFNFRETPNLVALKADYDAHIFVFGIAYHF